jgi:glutamate/aspartate transport system substrate-binding protein
MRQSAVRTIADNTTTIEKRWGHSPEHCAARCGRSRSRAPARRRWKFSLSGIETGLETGSLDAACGLVSSPRRLAIGQPVGKPIYLVRHYLAVRRNDPVRNDPVTIESTDDLVRLGDLVTTQRASVFTERLREAGVRIDDATDDNRVNLRKILAGHGRFAIRQRPDLVDKLKASGELDRIHVRWENMP